jgi:hypothetical protein
LWNESRAAGLHHFIEPLPGLNSIDFVKRIFRRTEMLRFSWARAAVLGVVSKAVPRCTAQTNSLRWRLSNSCGNCRNDWIFKWPWPHSVTQWRESQKMPFSLQNSRSSVSGRYGCASTWTTAGLILADS